MAVLVLILLVVVIILCCKRKQTRVKTVNEATEDAEKLDILADKEEDKDSGNDSSDGIQTSPEPERESLIQVIILYPVTQIILYPSSRRRRCVIRSSRPPSPSSVLQSGLTRFNKIKSSTSRKVSTRRRSSLRRDPADLFL